TTQWIMGAIEEFIQVLMAMKIAFVALWETSSIHDLFEPVPFFLKIVALFTKPVKQLIAFVKRVMTKIFEVLLQIMMFPANLAKQIIEDIKKAFESIKADPIGFLLRLLGAVKEGFVRFFDNIGTHLLAGVTGWLVGQVSQAGIAPPKDFSPGSILGFVFDILGLTIDRLWQKLGEKIGHDKVAKIKGALDKLKGFWLFVKDVIENGISAVWKYIKEQISGLWDMVLEEVRGWIITKIIEKVVTKLLSMLDPTGIMAVVNGFIAFFKAVQSAIEYFQQMLEIVGKFIGSLAEIARGTISAAAKFLQDALAKALPVAIGFLANQVGLGKIGKKIGEIIGKVRGLIDGALNWLVEKGKALIGQVFGKGGKETESENAQDPEKEAKIQQGLADIDEEEQKYLTGGKISYEDAQKVAKTVKQRHPVFKSIEVIDGGDKWNYHYKGSEGTMEGEQKKEGESIELAEGKNQQNLGIIKSPEITNRRGNLKRGTLAIGSPPFLTAQAHHLIAVTATKGSTLMEAAKESGYNINNPNNGIYLPKDPQIAISVKRPIHKGGHLGDYYSHVRNEITGYENIARAKKGKSDAWTEIKVLTAINTIENTIRSQLLDKNHPLVLHYNDPFKNS
ncbi:MAG: AHH domain-containing protein, partial [Flavobacteriales bacterium]|nr:AHH domain-containing protein [Flavobacteriales bacterium]